MTTTMRGLVLALALCVAMALGACASGDNGQPAPTATAASVSVPTPVVQSVAGSPITIVSLAGGVSGFLAGAATLPVMEQSSAFWQVMATQGAGCFDALPARSPLLALLGDLTGYALPLADLTLWEDAVRQFPEDELLAQAAQALEDAGAVLPIDAPLHVCLIPMPAAEIPPVLAGDYSNVPLLTATYPLNVIAARGDVIIVACNGTAACLEDFPQELLRAYGQAYWLATHRQELAELDVMARAVLEGFGYSFAAAQLPDAAFRWQAMSSVEAQSQARGWLQAWIDDPRALRGFENALLYGYAGDDLFPAWGGVLMGVALVDGYRERHPDQSWAEIAPLPVMDIVAGSGIHFE